jgi:surface polysaccharide O-acyltransferase-like enzyme
VVAVLDRSSSWRVLSSAVLTGRLYTGLYFFPLILGLYLVTPLLARALAGFSRQEVLRIGLVLTAVTCAWDSTVAYVASHSRIDVAATPTVFTYWVPYVGYFVLGCALAGMTVSRQAGLRALLVAVAAAAVNTFVASGYGPDRLEQVLPTDYQGWAVAVLTVALFVAALGLLPPAAGSPSLTQRVLERAGAMTLGVFAGHLLVLYALQHSGVLTVVHGASRLSELAYLTVGTVVLAYPATWALSYVPGVRRLV